MALSWPFKDPNEVLDYDVDWTARLAGDTIVSSDWTVPAEITEDSNSFSETVAKIWLSGGTISEQYELLNRIVTAGGRTMDQTVKLKIKAK